MMRIIRNSIFIYQQFILMLMVFIWLGSILPERHYKVLSDCENHPGNKCILLQDYHYQYYLQKYKPLLNISQDRIDRLIMVEKTDLLRLFYLYEKGGVYSDMDNSINYSCLEKFIEEKNDTQFFSQEQGQPWFPSNNFIYSPTPKHPNIEYVIKKIQQCQYCTDLEFASPFMLKRIGGINFYNVRECIQHGFQSSWKWFAGAYPYNYIDPGKAVDFANCKRQMRQLKKMNLSLEKLHQCSKEVQICQKFTNDLILKQEQLKLQSKKITEDFQNCKSNLPNKDFLTQLSQSKQELEICKEETKILDHIQLQINKNDQKYEKLASELLSIEKNYEFISQSTLNNINESKQSSQKQQFQKKLKVFEEQLVKCEKNKGIIEQKDLLLLFLGVTFLTSIICLLWSIKKIQKIQSRIRIQTDSQISLEQPEKQNL